MYQKCLRRKRISALNQPGEYLNTKTLSLQEWIFVFERVGELGRETKDKVKVTESHVKACFTDKTVKARVTNNPETFNILDLRYHQLALFIFAPLLF